MARSNEGKYKDFSDGSLVEESDLDTALQDLPGDYRDEVRLDLFGNGVLTNGGGWLVKDSPGVLAVEIAAGAGLVAGQRLASPAGVTLIGLTASATVKIYVMAHVSDRYSATERGWPAAFGFTTGAIPAGSLLLAEVVTGTASNTSVTDKRVIINSKTGMPVVSQAVPAADQAKGISDRASMIASRIQEISGDFGDSDPDKKWYEQLSGFGKGGPRLHARDRSLYGLEKKFEDTLSGSTATPTTTPTLTPAGSGGDLLNGTYYFVHTWVDVRGDETAISPEAAAVVVSGIGMGQVTVTAAISLPTYAASFKVYGSRNTGGPYIFQKEVAGTNTLIVTNFAMTGATPPTENETHDVYSHDHAGIDHTVSGAKVDASNVIFTPAGNITSHQVRAAIRSVNNNKVSLTGDDIDPGPLIVQAPVNRLDIATKSSLDTYITTLGPSQFVEKDIVKGQDIGDPDFGPEVVVFNGTIKSNGGLIMLTADSGITTEGALTHSNQFYALHGPEDAEAGQPLFPNDPAYVIPDWKKVVLLVWRFYRNGTIFRTSVHAWHSARLDYNAQAYFFFDGLVRQTLFPGSRVKLIRPSKNYVHTIGPIQTTTWGSAFRYCVWTPPPKIVDADVKGKAGAYTYEVRVAGITGSTSYRAINMQGFVGWTDFEGWTVTNGVSNLTLNIAAGSAVFSTDVSGKDSPHVSSTTSTTTITVPGFQTALPIWARKRFSSQSLVVDFGSGPVPNNAIEIARVNTNVSQATSITSSKTGPVLPGPGRLNLVEFR